MIHRGRKRLQVICVFRVIACLPVVLSGIALDGFDIVPPGHGREFHRVADIAAEQGHTPVARRVAIVAEPRLMQIFDVGRLLFLRYFTAPHSDNHAGTFWMTSSYLWRMRFSAAVTTVSFHAAIRGAQFHDNSCLSWMWAVETGRHSHGGQGRQRARRCVVSPAVRSPSARINAASSNSASSESASSTSV